MAKDEEKKQEPKRPVEAIPILSKKIGDLVDWQHKKCPIVGCIVEPETGAQFYLVRFGNQNNKISVEEMARIEKRG